MTKEKILRLVAIFAVVVFSFFLILFGLSFFFEDKIKSSVIYNINNSLTTPVNVGEIDFTLIKHFPYAALQFKNVNTKGSGQNNVDLLKAEKVNLLFNFFSLFSDKFLLKKIVIENAELNLLTGKNGETNFDVFKKDSLSDKSLSAEVEEFVLKNSSVNIRNKQTNFTALFFTGESSMSGSFSAEKFIMQTQMNVDIKEVTFENTTYISSKASEIKTGISINTKIQEYGFEKAQIKIADLILSVNGIVQNSNETFIDLKIISESAKLNNVLSILPSTWIPQKVLDYTYTGNVIFDAYIKGVSSKKQSPLIVVNFNSSGNSIIPDNSTYSLQNISLTGFFTNKKSEANPVSVLSFKNIKAMLEGKPVKGSVVMENLSNPFVDISVDAEVSLAAVSRYITSELIENPQGNISLHGFIKGRGDRKESYRSSGSARVSDVSFKFRNKPIGVTNCQGNLVFDGNNISVADVSGKAGNTDFLMNGKIENFYSYIFQPAQKLAIDLEILSRSIDMNELMQNDKNPTDTITRIDFPADIILEIKINATKTVFRKFTANNINGSLSLKNKVLSTNSLLFQAVEGNFYLQGAIDATAKDSLLITYEAAIKNVNIQKLFSEMGSFGQDVLTDKNIRGTATATVELASVWSKTLNVNSSRIYSKCDITIQNGELINFSPMLKLSRFVKGTDLKNVKFSTLKNQIEIKNRKIFIPAMDIKSTALNLTVNGVHDFDNMVDYNIQMKMSQLIGKKVKQANTEFGTIEDHGSGGLNLFLTMKGPIDNPKFAYDRKSVEQKITTSVKQGKDDFIKTIKDEFKGVNKDKSLKNDKDKKEPELQIDTEEEN